MWYSQLILCRFIYLLIFLWSPQLHGPWITVLLQDASTYYLPLAEWLPGAKHTVLLGTYWTLNMLSPEDLGCSHISPGVHSQDFPGCLRDETFADPYGRSWEAPEAMEPMVYSPEPSPDPRSPYMRCPSPRPRR